MKKRAHSELSSVSENDSSINITPTKNPKKKQNKQKKQEESSRPDLNEDAIKDIQKQLKQINDKMANVMTKMMKVSEY